MSPVAKAIMLNRSGAIEEFRHENTVATLDEALDRAYQLLKEVEPNRTLRIS